MSRTALFLALIATTTTLAADAPSAGGAPVLLDFHADWCGPCKQMRPEIAKLSRAGYPVKSVDIDKDRETARRYAIQAVPTFVVVDESGEVLGRSSGYQPASQLAATYREARAKARPPAAVAERRETEAEADDLVDAEADAERTAPLPKKKPNPDP